MNIDAQYQQTESDPENLPCQKTNFPKEENTILPNLARNAIKEWTDFGNYRTRNKNSSIPFTSSNAQLNPTNKSYRNSRKKKNTLSNRKLDQNPCSNFRFRKRKTRELGKKSTQKLEHFDLSCFQKQLLRKENLSEPS